METLRNTIKKHSKAMAVVSEIVYIALIVAICIPIFTLIWMAISPDSDAITAGSITFKSPTGFTLENRGDVIAEMIGIIAASIPMLFVFITACKMFKEINKTGEPFSDLSVSSLKRIGILIAVYAVAAPIVRAIACLIFTSGDISLLAGIDLATILIAVLFFFLSAIFEYGVRLQQLSDETL